MKQSLLVITFFIFCSLISNAQVGQTMEQMPPAIPLESGDIDKLIKTMKPMQADFEALGEEFKQKSQNYTEIKEVLAKEEVQRIFRKYGWDGEQWYGKFMTTMYAYGMLVMEKEMKALSEEERKQVEQFQGAYLSQMKSMITENDLKLVKNQYQELETFFEEQQNEGN